MNKKTQLGVLSVLLCMGAYALPQNPAASQTVRVAGNGLAHLPPQGPPTDSITHAAGRWGFPAPSNARPPFRSEPDGTYPLRYKIRGISLSYPTIKDQFLSPFPYSGLQAGASGSTLVKGRNWVRLRNFTAQVGLLRNGINESSLIAPRLGFDYSYLRLLYESPGKRLQLYAGGLYDIMLLFKYLPTNANNVFAHDLVTALHAAGMLGYRFHLRGKAFTLTNQLSVPVVGLLSRPEYAWAVPYPLIEKEAKLSDHVRVATPGNYVRLRNCAALDFRTAKTTRRTGKIRENYWRLSYTWDYHQIGRPNRTQTGGHALGFGRVLQF